MIKQHTHKQETPASTWTITIPEGGSRARPIAAYTPAGNSLSWDSWSYRDGQLIVDFGIDTQFGELDFEYEDGKTSTGGSATDEVSYESDGNIVNITINQSGMNRTPS